MTEVVQYEAPRPIDPTGGRLQAWALSLTAASQIGRALCSTSFVPATFRGKPEEAAAAILFGDEIGFTPTQSLQSIYLIGGKPALYARAMVALVLAAGHEVETVEKSEARVTVRGRRRGSETWMVETWTKARAEKAGYTKNAKYQTDAEAMLYARATSDICRQVAPDALAGIAFSAEELEAEAAPVTVTVTRASAKPEPPAPAVEPPVEVDTETGEITDAEVVDEQPSDTITDAQMRKMRALLGQVGMRERAAVLEYVRGVVGREVESSKWLTKAEAMAVIDALTELADLTEPAEPPLDGE
jgi:hypothetical protein